MRGQEISVAVYTKDNKSEPSHNILNVQFPNNHSPLFWPFVIYIHNSHFPNNKGAFEHIFYALNKHN